METKTSELIARGILFKEEKILLCKAISGGHHFLPGGHIEFGEKAEDTLPREFIEETGEKIEVGKFVGAFETKYGEGEVHHELNLVFLIKTSAENITSKEDHIEYLYVNKEEFEKIKFLPKFMKEVILQFWDNQQTFWASDM